MYAIRSYYVPVVHGVAFGYGDVDEWLDVALCRKEGHIYGRNTNPTVAAFEEKVRLLEGAEAAVSASTGMGIISSALFGLLKPGDRVVSLKDTYGGTNRLFSEFLPRFGIKVALCETTDFEAIEAETRITSYNVCYTKLLRALQSPVVGACAGGHTAAFSPPRRERRRRSSRGLTGCMARSVAPLCRARAAEAVSCGRTRTITGTSLTGAWCLSWPQKGICRASITTQASYNFV